jgi:hypothetical protein
MTKGYNIASLSTYTPHDCWWFPCFADILAVAAVPSTIASSIQTLLMAAVGFLALLAFFLLLVYPLPLASLPAFSLSCCYWFPCFAGILALAEVTCAAGVPSCMLPLLLLLVSLFCWHPCCCWCTLCHCSGSPCSPSCYCWFPCFAGILAVAGVPYATAVAVPAPTPAIVGFLVLLASLLLLVYPLPLQWRSLLPLLLLLVSLFCWHPCCC